MSTDNRKLQLSFNSPIILGFTFICFAVMILDQLTGGFTTRVCGNPVTLDSKEQFSITYTNNDKDAYLSVNFYDVNGYEFDAYGLCLNKYTATVEGVKNKNYTGKAVKQSGLTVKAGYDPASYILSYKNNTGFLL